MSSSVPVDRSVDEPWYVALDGRCVRSFDMLFPKRVWQVLPAALFALEACSSEPFSSQSVWLQSCTWSRHARGFALSKAAWTSMAKRVAKVPTLPVGMYPDYLFLPWQTGQITIAKEGNWCRVRSGESMGYSVSMTSLSLLLGSLQKEQVFDNVLVYTDDGSLDWDGLSDLATMVFEEQAPWRVDCLPHLAQCQDRLSITQQLGDMSRSIQHAFAQSSTGRAFFFLGLCVLGLGFGAELSVVLGNHHARHSMQDWLNRYVPVKQHAAWWSTPLTQLNSLVEKQGEDPALSLLERSSHCAPEALKSWTLLGVTATPTQVVWRYQPTMVVSWQAVTTRWSMCLKKEGMRLTLWQHSAPLFGITINVEKEL